MSESQAISGVAADAEAPVSVPAVELLGITKAFPGVVANDGIDLVVRRGEVHCLLGENGAGKSTLMHILSGMLNPDSGEVRAGGRPVVLDSPKRALELGIGTVYQHSTLIPTLTVLQNLMLGSSDGLRIDRKGSQQRLEELAGTLGIEVDPDVPAGSLSLGEQQQVEIVKALWRGSSVLILDEPTSMLTPQGAAELAAVVRRLKQHGLAVIFITHKLHEALEMGDCVTVLRHGKVVGTLSPERLAHGEPEVLRAEIVHMMFGDLDEERRAGQVAELQDHVEGHGRRRVLPDEPLLELIHVSTPRDRHGAALQDVSFVVRRGEILGIAGVDGNGQRELAEAIAGQRRLLSGEIRLGGRAISTLGTSKRERLGLRYVTDDRLGEGTVSALSVAMNLVLKRIGQRPFWRQGSVRVPEIRATAEELVREFDVRTPSVDAPVGQLSGGNVQKVVLARELSFDPKVVVYSKPTYGLDVKTTMAVRGRIRDGAEKGVSSVVISTDLEELLDLSDRIAVLFRGRIVGLLDNAPGIEKRLGELMLAGAAA